MTTYEVTDLKLGLITITPERAKWLRRLPTLVVSLVTLFAIVWVMVAAAGTSAGTAIEEPGEFVVTVLNGLTLAGLYFVVASGFTLIFGLMRTVNMAHGAFFVFAAYIAIEVQQSMVGKERNIDPVDVSMLEWIIPVLVGATVVAVLGVIMQQVLLSWNQGQELRQAIITVAVAVILADQMLGKWPLATGLVWPDAVVKFFDDGGDFPAIVGQRYPLSRLFMLGVAVLVGVLLWLWLNRTRMGMVIRAGVDDKDMVRALGIRISATFAVTFFVGSFLAGLGGGMGGSFSPVAPGTDGEWLLNALVVVIIGGLGSIRGAVAGSVLYGMVLALSPAYLPAEYTFYSRAFTLVVLAIVLAVRPYGLYGRPG